MAVRSLRWVSDYRTDRVDSIKLFSSYRQNSLPSLVAVKSLRWVSDYRTDRVDSIKLFSSVRQNMISWHFRPLRWVSDYRTDRVDSIKLFSSYRQNSLPCLVAVKIASLGVGLSYGQGRLHKLFSSYRQNSLPSLVAVRSLRWVSDYRTDRVDSIKLFFFSSPKYDFLAFQTGAALDAPPPRSICMSAPLQSGLVAVVCWVRSPTSSI